MGLFKRRKRQVAGPGNTCAVILAGGRSERFGQTKGLTELQGRPMVRWVAQVAAAVSAHTVLVLAPDMAETRWRAAIGQTDPARPTKKDKKQVSSLDVVHDPAPHRGPVAGVGAALPKVDQPFTLLLPTDMPLLRPDLLLGLHERISGHDAVAYHLEGWWRPFPSLWRTDGLAMALRRADQQGIQSLRGLLDLLDARPLGPEFLSLFGADVSTLSSINTQEDLDAAAARLVS